MTALADDSTAGHLALLGARTRWLIASGAVAVVAGGAAVAAVLKRDADVECPPPCKLEAEKPPKPGRQ